MILTIAPVDILYLVIGIGIGLILPHGRRYAGRYYSNYRRRRYRY